MGGHAVASILEVCCEESGDGEDGGRVVMVVMCGCWIWLVLRLFVSGTRWRDVTRTARVVIRPISDELFTRKPHPIHLLNLDRIALSRSRTKLLLHAINAINAIDSSQIKSLSAVLAACFNKRAPKSLGPRHAACTHDFISSTTLSMATRSLCNRVRHPH
jgi:hypothetical protein